MARPPMFKAHEKQRIVLSVLAYWKGRTGREMVARRCRPTRWRLGVCSYLSLALLAGVGAYAAFGWAWADPSVRC